MAGYSDTPLAKKLGIKEGFKVFLVKAPAQYRRTGSIAQHTAQKTVG